MSRNEHVREWPGGLTRVLMVFCLFQLGSAMLRLSMLVGCIFVTSPGPGPGPGPARAMKQQEQHPTEQDLNSNSAAADDGSYSVTCYMCVNVSDNLVCNQYAIDRPCTAGPHPAGSAKTQSIPPHPRRLPALVPQTCLSP